MMGRRSRLTTSALGAGGRVVAPLRSGAADSASPTFGTGQRPRVAYSGKRPLRQMPLRLPQRVTPFAVSDAGATGCARWIDMPLKHVVDQAMIEGRQDKASAAWLGATIRRPDKEVMP
ncbi:hypothetical protein [Methylobacterium fujisawaense]|uniref:hypothetical protein n=1 Tax=Methylobacterium fujisawaense TaxID=107400 RepID=UPI0036F55D8C